MTARDFIKDEEGLKLAPYRCSRKKLSIGWGFNLEANPLPPSIAEYLSAHGQITREMADELFEVKYCEAERESSRLFAPIWPSLNDPQRAALIAMCYQMGAAGVAGFRKGVAFINSGKLAQGAFEILDSVWEDQTEARAHACAIMLASGEWLER